MGWWIINRHEFSYSSIHYIYIIYRYNMYTIIPHTGLYHIVYLYIRYIFVYTIIGQFRKSNNLLLHNKAQLSLSGGSNGCRQFCRKSNTNWGSFVMYTNRRTNKYLHLNIIASVRNFQVNWKHMCFKVPYNYCNFWIHLFYHLI